MSPSESVVSLLVCSASFLRDPAVFFFLCFLACFLFFCGGLWALELELLDIDACLSEPSLWLSSALLEVLLTDGCLVLLLGFFFFLDFSFLRID
jgi:hypothetical protein